MVKMDEQRADALRDSAPAQLVVEHDARLGVGQATLPIPFASPWSSRVAPAPRRRQEISFRVLGREDQPVAGAGVTVFGKRFNAQAITDSSGIASVAIFDAEADLDDIRAVYVQPMADHWECFVHQPILSTHEPNVITLDPLAPAGAHSVGETRAAWGRKLMHLERLAQRRDRSIGRRRGEDRSGLTPRLRMPNKHPLLRHVTRGVDLGPREGGNGWTRDEIGQGTHCAGIIAGVSSSASAGSGIAPGAELHVFKLSPGGHFSDLIEALDQCIERQLDIVCLGVSSDHVSELVAQKIAEARLAGVACIAAAGDEGGPVQFPAMVLGVLAVSAIGRLGEFPAATHHGWTAFPELVGPGGLFATTFKQFRPADCGLRTRRRGHLECSRWWPCGP